MDPSNLSVFTNPTSGDLQILTRAARQSLTLVKRWKETQSLQNHEAVDAVVTRVIDEGARYYEAITISVQTADEGYTFANEAANFCERLARLIDSPESLDRDLKNMLHIADKAHRGASAMNEKFRTVRVNIFEITKLVPNYVKKVEREQLMSTTTDHTSSEVLVQLQTANDDLGVLVQHTAAFVDWWDDMIQSLKYLEGTIPLIKPDGSNPFRTERLTDRWHDISQEYALYRSRMTEVQDFYFDLLPEPTVTNEQHSEQNSTLTKARKRKAEKARKRAVEAKRVEEAREIQARRLAEKKAAKIDTQRLKEQATKPNKTEEEQRKAETEAQKKRAAREQEAAQTWDLEANESTEERGREEKQMEAQRRREVGEQEAAQKREEEANRHVKERRRAEQQKAEMETQRRREVREPEETQKREGDANRRVEEARQREEQEANRPAEEWKCEETRQREMQKVEMEAQRRRREAREQEAARKRGEEANRRAEERRHQEARQQKIEVEAQRCREATQQEAARKQADELEARQRGEQQKAEKEAWMRRSMEQEAAQKREAIRRAEERRREEQQKAEMEAQRCKEATEQEAAQNREEANRRAEGLEARREETRQPREQQIEVETQRRRKAREQEEGRKQEVDANRRAEEARQYEEQENGRAKDRKREEQQKVETESQRCGEAQDARRKDETIKRKSIEVTVKEAAEIPEAWRKEKREAVDSDIEFRRKETIRRETAQIVANPKKNDAQEAAKKEAPSRRKEATASEVANNEVALQSQSKEQARIAAPNIGVGGSAGSHNETPLSDYKIAILGLKGSKKADFIRDLCPKGVLHIGEVSEYHVEVSKQSVALIDIPEIDDLASGEADALQDLENFLQTRYEKPGGLAGIIHVHHMLDLRVGGVLKRNFKKFQELCGESDTLMKVVIVTHESDLDTKSRESLLRNSDMFFRPALELGAKMMSHDKGSHDSAMAILGYFLALETIKELIAIAITASKTCRERGCCCCTVM